MKLLRSLAMAFGAAGILATLSPGESPAAGTAAGPAAPPALQMRHVAGWGGGVLSECTVAADGSFRYSERDRAWSGVLPAADLRGLVERVAAAGPGPAAEDAGHVRFTWTEAGGKAGGEQDYSHPPSDPCRGLLLELRTLALRHGRLAGVTTDPPPTAAAGEVAVGRSIVAGRMVCGDRCKALLDQANGVRPCPGCGVPCNVAHRTCTACAVKQGTCEVCGRPLQPAAPPDQPGRQSTRSSSP